MINSAYDPGNSVAIEGDYNKCHFRLWLKELLLYC